MSAQGENKIQIDNDEAFKKFKDLVNMTPAQIEKWLGTEESKKGGIEDSNGDTVGRNSGKKIIEILHKKKSELNEKDYAHMHKVISYISRHSAQKPKEVEGSKWLYSLKNWGHDPEKK